MSDSNIRIGHRYIIANDISPLTGEPEQFKGLRVRVTSTGGRLGDWTVALLDPIDVVHAAMLRNDPSLASFDLHELCDEDDLDGSFELMSEQLVLPHDDDCYCSLCIQQQQVLDECDEQRQRDRVSFVDEMNEHAQTLIQRSGQLEHDPDCIERDAFTMRARCAELHALLLDD